MAIVVMRALARPNCEREVAQLLIDARDFATACAGFMEFDRYRGDNGEIIALLEFETHETLAAWRDRADNGEIIALLEFETHETLAAWRDRADNMLTQRTDRDRLFQRYRIQVCDIVREYEFAG